MGELRLIEGPWERLEEGLVERLRSAPVARPWSPRWLLVPHRELRTHLFRRLAERLGAAVGLHVFFLRDAATAVLEASGAPPPTLLSETARDLLLRDAVREQTPAIESLLGGTARVTPAFHQALRKTVFDLREAGIAPAAVADLAAGAGGRARGRLRTVAAVYRSWSERIERLARASRSEGPAVYDREGLFRAAAAALAAATLVPAEQVVVYGFYDLTGGQAVFLDALATATDVDLLVPVYPETEAYAGSLLAGWRVRAGEGGPDREPGTRSGSGDDTADGPAWLPLTDLFERLREPVADGEGVEEGSATVTIASAPGPGREVDVALRLLAAAWSSGWPAETTRVAAPVPESYRRLLQEEAAGAAFGPLEASGEEERRALHTLLAILDLTAEEVAAATLARAVEELIGPDEPEPPGERLLRELAPAAPLGGWVRLLEAEYDHTVALITDLEAEAEKKPPDDDPEVAPDHTGRLRRLRRRRERLTAGLECLHEVADRLDDLPVSADWMDWARRLEELLGSLKTSGDEGPSLDLLRSLAVLGTPGSREDVRWVVRRRLQETGPAPPFPYGSIMDLRGCRNRLTLVLGMSETGWPRRPSPDPLLLDPERQQLREGQEWLLPDARHRLHEDRLLFRLLLTSARHVVLLYPRLDVTGKVRRASPHLLGLARRIVDPTLTQNDLEALVRLGIRPLDEPSPGPDEPLLGRLDRDLAAVGRAIGDHAPQALYALWDSPTFRAGWRAEQARWQKGPGPWSGFLSPAAARAAALRFGLGEPGRLSISRLQDYAVCPWRAFLLHVLGLPRQRETLAGRLDPLERGQVVHRVLEQFVREEVTTGCWPPDPGAAPDVLVRLEGLVAREVARAYRARGRPAPVLERVDRRRLLDRLQAWLTWEQEEGEGAGEVGAGSLRGGWMPVAFEEAFELPIEVADRHLGLHGRLDRVDVGPEGQRRILDYKTGRSRPSDPGDPEAGTNLQLALYLKTLRDTAESGVAWAGGLLLHLPPGGAPRALALTAEQLEQNGPGLVAVVAGLLESVEGGVFTRLPHDRHTDSRSGGLCRDCPAPIICRGWRIEESRRHLTDDRLHPLNRVRAAEREDTP